MVIVILDTVTIFFCTGHCYHKFCFNQAIVILDTVRTHSNEKACDAVSRDKQGETDYDSEDESHDAPSEVSIDINPPLTGLFWCCITRGHQMPITF